MRPLPPAPVALASLLLALTCPAADVRDFGAVGDGSTDDTAAILRAIAENTDGLVSFPKGDYRITATLAIDLARHGRLAIDGSGGTARLLMAAPGPAIRLTGTHQGTAAPPSVTAGVWQAERMPQITGLEIVGDHPEADGIELVQTMQATLQRLLLRKLRHGVVLSGRNRNLLIDACHIYENSGIGIHFDQVNLHQAIIQGSHISYNRRAGIAVQGGEIRNIQITGNDIEYNHDPEAEGSADILFDLSSGSLAEGTIVSNTIQARPSPGGANIRFIGPGRPQPRTQMGLFAITGNLIGNQQTNVHLVQARGVTVTGNHIYSGTRRSLVLDRCQHLVIADNSLDQSHNHQGDHTNGITVEDCDGVILKGIILDRAGGEAAVELLRSREVSVTSCQIFEPIQRGILIDSCRNTRIADNLILDRTGAPTLSAAIEIGGSSRTTLITGTIHHAPILDPAASAILHHNHQATP